MPENANLRKKILMVDDDEINLVTAELFLKNDYDITKMKSGKDAIEYLEANDYIPNLVLLDIMMPNMNGWELFKKLQVMPKLDNIPIVFLTALVSEEEKKRAFRLGIADYIHKPFNMVDLKKSIGDILIKYSKIKH